jgi:2-polyprenyl-3-methyl-5-hydroxy-6-metoxy-1,4-benzoquinol methylase
MKPSQCPVCSSTSVKVFLRRNNVPLFQNMDVKNRRDAGKKGKGNLRLKLCSHCGFIFNACFDPRRLNYTGKYENAQSFSREFQAHEDGLVSFLTRERSVKGCEIVEVGCGKGVFLTKLVKAGNRGVGFDPAYVGPLTALRGKLRFVRRKFDRQCARQSADVVISRHVIEHVNDPVALLKLMRLVFKGSNGRLFLETPDVEWMLRNQTIWDFFYEHCSYFSRTSIATALETAGFSVKAVRRVFGGQYLWVEAVPAPIGAGKVTSSRPQRTVVNLASKLGGAENGFKHRWRRFLRNAGGGVAVWGCGAKGVTFLNMVDPKCDLIECVVDINPRKQGHFVPLTGHPIVGFDSLPKHGVKTIISMNPNYRREILETLAAEGMKLKLVEPDRFSGNGNSGRAGSGD